MKGLIKVFAVIMLFNSFKIIAQSDTMRDSRDGKVYKTIKIGTQMWMTENMGYKIATSKDFTEYFLCYKTDEKNCEKYGMLYTWDAAKKTCPAGWHLPSKEEYDTLLATVGKGNLEKAYTELIEGGDSGFESLLGGSFIGKFHNLGIMGSFWTSTEKTKDGAIPFLVSKGFKTACTSATPKKYAATRKENALSVRCIKD
jgi:uncharacterized protein (TIGR02145 family)